MVLTSSALCCDQQKAFARGASWFEVKPQTFDEMVDLVRTFPGRAQAGDYALPPGYPKHFGQNLERLSKHQRMIDAAEDQADFEYWAKDGGADFMPPLEW